MTLTALGFQVNKHLAICQTGIAFFVVAGVLSSLVCRLNRKVLKPYLARSETLYIFTQMALLCLVGYYSRSLVRKVPFIFDGVFGYDHSRLKEIQGGVVIAYAIFAMQEGLDERVRKLPLLRFVTGGTCSDEATEPEEKADPFR